MWVSERNPEATVKERLQHGGQKRCRETRLVGEAVWLQRWGRSMRSGDGLQPPWFLSWW